MRSLAEASWRTVWVSLVYSISAGLDPGLPLQSDADLLDHYLGLGKTLMTLANIVNGKPVGKEKQRRTTLVVASPALVNQVYGASPIFAANSPDNV
jgi:hypothetical protein